MKLKLLLIIFFTNIIFASNTNTFILNHSGLIDKRAYEKINEIALEVQNKIGINIYLDVKGNNGIDESLAMKDKYDLMKKKENELLINTKKISSNEFVILVFALDQKHANILFSNNKLKEIIDKDDVLNSYVIPLLASHDKNLRKSKVSAATLNGIAQIADVLAQHNNIELKSSIGSQGKITSTIWRVFIYTLVVIGIVSYIIIILRERKYKKEHE